MAGHPDGLVTFESGGDKFTAVFGFKAMKAVEAHYDQPFFVAVQGMLPGMSAEDFAAADGGDRAAIAKAAKSFRFTEVGVMLGFALMKHHDDLTDDDVAEIIDDIGILKAAEIAFQALTTAATGMEADDTSSEDPPKPNRAARRARKTG